jgi:hypothetical protein
MTEVYLAVAGFDESILGKNTFTPKFSTMKRWAMLITKGDSMGGTKPSTVKANRWLNLNLEMIEIFTERLSI